MNVHSQNSKSDPTDLDIQDPLPNVSPLNKDPYIECVSIIGTKLRFDLSFLSEFLKRLDVWLLIVSFVALMVATDPTQSVELVGYTMTGVVWLFVALLYVGMTLAILIVFYLVLKNSDFKAVIMPFVGFVVIAALISLGPTIEYVFFGNLGKQSRAVPMRDIFLCLLVEQVFVTIYISLGYYSKYNRSQKSVELTDRSLDPGASCSVENSDLQSLALEMPFGVSDVLAIEFGKFTLNASDIVSMSAEEHYVRIATVAGEEIIRGTFSNLVSKVPEGIGFKIHRSHWVSYAHVQKIVKHNSHYVAVLGNEKVLPIAKARKQEFQEQFFAFKGISN